MKKIQIIALSVSAVCIFSAVFTACDKNTVNSETTTVSETQIITESNTLSEFPTNKDGVAYSMGDDGHRYYIYPEKETTAETTAAPTEKQTTAVKTTKAKTTKVQTTKTEKTTKKSATTTQSNVPDVTVKDENKGFQLLIKTPSVKKGTTATISILGQAGKTYSIDFYKNQTETASYDGLGSKTADENGMVVWTFAIGYDCETGTRKILIKEKGSDNFVQTSITVE